MIETYVFLDLETTGLPDKSYGLQKIIEISLITVSVKHFSDCSPGSIPRVKNKLTKCFHPRRFIAPISEKITGLTNELLEEQATFDPAACELITNFLTSLPQPICLLAHNGYNHDFKLLQAHIKLHGRPLPDSILCCDTLPAFRQLQILQIPFAGPWGFPSEVVKPYLSQVEEQEKWMEHSSTEINNVMDQIEKEHLCQLEVELIVQQEQDLVELDKETVMKELTTEEELIARHERDLDEFDRMELEEKKRKEEAKAKALKEKTGKVEKEYFLSLDEELKKQESLEIEAVTKKREKENTMSKEMKDYERRKLTGVVNKFHDKQLNVDELHGRTPTKPALEQWSPVKITTPKRKDNSPHDPSICPQKVRRQLFKSPEHIKVINIKDLRPSSYRLRYVYQRLFNKEITDAHSAEGDSYALLECITAIGPRFHQWVSENNVKFSSIIKAW